MPIVCKHPSIRGETVTPGEVKSIVATASRIFPFGFGRQRFTSPGSVSFSIHIDDMYDRMVFQSLNRASWTQWFSPPGTETEDPPLRRAHQVHGRLRRHKNQRTSFSHLQWHTGIILRIRRALGEGLVSSGLHEDGELSIGDRCSIDPEFIDMHFADRSLFRIEAIRTHSENATGQINHAFRGTGVHYHV
ncbi:hypothetical protein D3C85_1110600 [compost metagenome]